MELNRRHTGEDARISVERARERRLNIEGRNLNADLDVAAPKPPVNARIQAGAPVVGVGCAALAEHLRAVAWPSKFRPHLPDKYDGTTNPSKLLQVYVTVITTAGGNDAVAGLWGTHSRVAERTRLFPVREDSGKYLGDWADLALRQEHTI